MRPPPSLFDRVLADLAAEYPDARPGDLLDLAFAEVMSADPFIPFTYRMLAEQGVDVAEVVPVVGPIGRAPVRFGPHGLFVFDAHGPDAFVIVARDGEGETPLDLVAWLPTKPTLFGTYRSAAALLPSRWPDGPRHSNPLAWLRANCRGTVVLPLAPLFALRERAA